MSTSTIDNGSAAQASFWTVRKWFVFLALFLVCWIGLYLYTHYIRNGYQYYRFTTEQLQQLNRILYQKDIAAPAEKVQIVDNTIRQTVSPTGDTIYDTIVNARPQTAAIAHADICNDSCRINKAMLYIRSEFDDKIKEDQLNVIRDYLGSFSAQEVVSFLAQVKLRVKCYFWLTGATVYFEVVFWVIIGVICSSIFALGNMSRLGKTAFEGYEIPYQVAKLFYAPFSTIIVILTYNYIKHRNVIEVNTNEGMIVFSFVAGLFSGRLMSLLERFKDVLLPENIATGSSATSTGTQQITHHEHRADTRMEAMPGRRVSNDERQQHLYEEPEIIKEVTVDLKLDASGLFEEEKTEILEIGFASAVVTLHNVNGKDIITARRVEEDGAFTFIAQDVKPGIYITRATLTQKLSDDYIINLFGEKTAYITDENNGVELYIKKYEAID
ncbi:MAG: hypothetical protein BGO69_01130 [Bacteroidetes bacterium 46-16]|nr:MAG: hypothetical protein BGO69_01130 [Bacteroidetes bacterium 46-16]